MLRALLQFCLICLLCLSFFLIHSCLSNDIYKDAVGVFKFEEPPLLQIGLSKFSGLNDIKIKINSAFDIVQKDTSKIPSRGSIKLKGQKLYFNETAITDYPVKISPESGTFYINGHGYRGSLVINLKGDKFILVNEVSIEDYLAGVVGKEMSLHFSDDALKAQVIAARSYALYQLKKKTIRNAEKFFDLYDDERSQVYGGLETENDKAHRIVKDTYGLVVSYKDRVVNTFYSSTCGGHTEAAWEVLDEGPEIKPLSGVACNYCKDSKFYRWQFSMSASEFAKRLFSRDAKIKSIRISRQTRWGRARQIGIHLDGSKEEMLLDANLDFRVRVGTHKMRSTLIDKIDLGDHKVYMEGRGWGHAAGMCQSGAVKMAQLGYDGASIIKHYYPDGKITRIY